MTPEPTLTPAAAFLTSLAGIVELKRRKHQATPTPDVLDDPASHSRYHARMSVFECVLSQIYRSYETSPNAESIRAVRAEIQYYHDLYAERLARFKRRGDEMDGVNFVATEARVALYDDLGYQATQVYDYFFPPLAIAS